VLPPVALILFATALSCFMRKGEDKITFKRHLQLYYALEHAKSSYLKGEDIILRPGEYGAWIEVITDPKIRKFLFKTCSGAATGN